jgi:hypothetical protein
LYNIKTPAKFIRERVTEIERPDWWPTTQEMKDALKPDAGVIFRPAQPAQSAK